MPPKTIYIKDADLLLWERADKAVRVGAAAHSMSALIADALRLYLSQFGDQGNGLFVKAPDDEDPVTFGPGISAVLVKDAASQTWRLWLDGEDPTEPPQSMGEGTVSEVVAAARSQMADSLSHGALEKAAARLRRALGIGNELTASDGRSAGRAWALERATPGELEAIGDLAHTEWVAFGSSGDASGAAWPTLYTELARHRPPADPSGEAWEIRRDDFTVGFVEEAGAVYEQILDTERNSSVSHTT
jgi:hypothetical protein